ncbi:MAG TPA: cbb3-type cytochrome oxidase assembly protein CcoS [Chromatiales bacterium]|nr:cbb3-type cytochrome oxidase assembly protein CcoS [Chromatiales bacterium]HEX22925.1 cbb3-type cytochrome oxidase assembly protein CcoS [Chromatiales bacterium]
MDVIYALIPGMIFLGLIMVGVLIWAVKSGQYDDLEGDAQRLLMDEDGNRKKRGKRRRKPTEGQAPKKDPGKNWPDAD